MVRRIHRTLAIYREDAYQLAIRRVVVITKIMNDVAATVDGDSPRHQIFANHLHQLITVREFGVVVPG
ncbi:MAG: hypothetical protein RRB22_11940 [Gammaproteobacteria bacterium]|nr:hypothetical protein [Gammaproteobacteria bacterium]